MFARQVKVENYQAVELHEYAVAVAKCAVLRKECKIFLYFLRCTFNSFSKQYCEDVWHYCDTSAVIEPI